MTELEFFNSITSASNSSITCILICALIVTLKKRTHSVDAASERKIKKKQLKKLFIPIFQIFQTKDMKFTTVKKRHRLFKYKADKCTFVEPLTEKEQNAITKLILKYDHLTPPCMVETWFHYHNNHDDESLWLFYDQFVANYNWTRQCIGMPCSDSIDGAYLPQRRSLYLDKLFFALFLTIFSLMYIALYCITPSVQWYVKLILTVVIAVIIAYTYTSWLDYSYNAKLNKL